MKYSYQSSTFKLKLDMKNLRVHHLHTHKYNFPFAVNANFRSAYLIFITTYANIKYTFKLL